MLTLRLISPGGRAACKMPEASLTDKYLSHLSPPVTQEDKAEAIAFYRDLPPEVLWDWWQDLRRTLFEGRQRTPGNQSEVCRMDLIARQIDWMQPVLIETGFEVNPPVDFGTPVREGQPSKPGTRTYKTPVARNLDELRLECGWSFEDLADATNQEKKAVIAHICHGKGLYPRTLKKYALAYSRELKRGIAVARLTR